MFALKITAWIQTKSGNKTDWLADFYTETQNDITAYFANAHSTEPLDPDFGMGIEFDEIDGLQKYVCDYRHSEFWCKPFWGADLKDIPDETQYLLYQKTDGTFGLFLPVVSENYKCVLVGNPNGGFTARIFSWYDKLLSAEGLVLIHTEGKDPFALFENAVSYALKLLKTGVRTRTERTYPLLLRYLGWCSWDAFQNTVSEEGLKQKCLEFKSKNIPVRWAILDDMWGEVREFYRAKYESFEQLVAVMHASTLYHLEADPIRFPNGLAHCIKELNDLGIEVGIWTPTTGYWSGLTPGGKAHQILKDFVIQDSNGRIVPSPDPEKCYMFYKTFHDFLRSCGASFVKIDNQSMIRRFYKNLAPVGKLAKNIHDAMESSVGSHFNGDMINCMGMASEDMWTRTASAICRCSDDFLPENRPWSAKHILQCAYNSLILGQFYWCDWDMWWTDDGQAGKNSVLSAICGGPVYVSDKLDRSRPERLSPLTLSDGSILQCDRPAYPTADCLVTDFEHPDCIFKLQNICGNSGVIAAFHLNQENKPLSGTISPADVYDLEGETFAVYEHFSRTVHLLKKDEKLSITLNNMDDYKLFIIVPYENEYAPIGLAEKFISPKTIAAQIGTEVTLYESGTFAYVQNGKLYFETR